MILGEPDTLKGVRPVRRGEVGVLRQLRPGLLPNPETLDVWFTWFLGGSHPAKRAQDVAGSMRI